MRPLVLVGLVILIVTMPVAWAQEAGPDRVPIADWTPLPADVTVSPEAQDLREELLGDHWDDPNHVTLHWTGVSSFIVTIGGHLLLFDAWEIIGAVTDYLPIGREELAALEPEAVLVGHGHFDHAGDLGYVAGRSGAAVVGSDEICTVAELGALREGVGTGFSCAITGTATDPAPGTWQEFPLFADLAPIGVLQHLHSAAQPPSEDNPLNPFAPIMDLQPYLDHLADDPDELARFLAQQVEQDQGGTWLYLLSAGDFGVLVGDSAGPIWDSPEVTAALEDMAGCVDVLANAILGFDQPVSGLRDPVLYVAATRPQVFVPTHADAWAPVISAGQAQYEDELRAELARQDIDVEVDLLLDPDDYLVERAYRVDDPRWTNAPGGVCPAADTAPAPDDAQPEQDDRSLPVTGAGMALLGAMLLTAAVLGRRRNPR